MHASCLSVSSVLAFSTGLPECFHEVDSEQGADIHKNDEIEQVCFPFFMFHQEYQQAKC
jgi:hypothetical protein